MNQQSTKVKGFQLNNSEAFLEEKKSDDYIRAEITPNCVWSRVDPTAAGTEPKIRSRLC